MGMLKAFFGNDPPMPVAQKPDAPDYATHWKQYSGWMANINDKAAGQMADVRARLSAAGASPDALMMQTEHLESQRKSDIASLEGGPTFGILKEGFDIARGNTANPYKTGMAGQVADKLGRNLFVPDAALLSMEKSDTAEGRAANYEASRSKIDAARDAQIKALPQDMAGYYSQFYGAASGPDAATPEAAAAGRAKIAAGGTAGAAAGGGTVGSASDVSLSPAFARKETFWG